MEVLFKVMYWNFEDEPSEDEDLPSKLCIQVAGRTEENETVHIKIHDFLPFVHLELPDIVWTQQKIKRVFKYFQATMKPNGPVKYSICCKKSLYFGKEVKCMILYFPNHTACRSLQYKCSRLVKVPGIPEKLQFRVHEYKIDPIIKFTAGLGINLASWIKATPEDYPEEFETSADISFRTSCNSVSPASAPENTVIYPTFFSFDIECNSKNPNSKLPDPDVDENYVFQIGVICGTLGTQEMKRYLLTLYDTHPIKDTTVLSYKTEIELLLGFSKLVRDEDPDIFIGYNIMKFDWSYMISRAKKLGIKSGFMELSRITDHEADLDIKVWSSSAYGEQSFEYPNCHGRTNVDVLLEVERNYRLPTYSLNAVSKYFLGDNKDDITPRQLFMLFKLTEVLTPICKKMKQFPTKKLNRDKINQMIKTIMPLRNTHGVVRELRTDMLECKDSELEYNMKRALTITGEYCVQDTILPVRLVEKLNLWTTMEEMSNVMHIPTTYLHTRGQGIKVLAQVYREVLNSGMFIPSNFLSNLDRYRGAIVIEAKKGYYQLVGTLDFASLYPSILMAFNICHTTLVTDESVPDSECNIVEWEDHIHCEHDTKRKLDLKKRLCGKHRYRFRKMKMGYDEKTGKITRIGEGLMPRLERNLLASRKMVKYEMFKAENKLGLHRGEFSNEEIEKMRAKGYEIIEKGSLTDKEEKFLEISAGVLNAKQLAIKVSANSVSGNTAIPCLKDGKFCYISIENIYNMAIGSYKEDEDGNQVISNIENSLMVWSDGGWSKINYVFRHKAPSVMKRVVTHTGCVDVTEDHSLLDENKQEVTTRELDVGDKLLHMQVPLPDDTPGSPSQEMKIINHDAFEHGVAIVSGLCKYLDEDILVSDYNTRSEFFSGYTSLLTNPKEFWCNKHHAPWLMWVAKSLGYYVTLDTKDDLFLLNILDKSDICSENVIKKIETISPPTEYVYDIETVTHHFAAGVGDLIVHNSCYGILGSSKGPIPLVEGAASITATGRNLIKESVERIKKEWPESKLVYGDTDSAMVTHPGKNTEESFDLAVESSELVTHYLKSQILGKDEYFTVNGYQLNKIKVGGDIFLNLKHEDKLTVLQYDAIPIDLEFENMYGKFLLLTKKRYIAHVINKDGKKIRETKKGVVLARRDNCEYLRSTYKDISNAIMNRLPEREIMNLLYDKVNDLFTRRIPDTHLIIYVGVKSVINYATKKKIENKNGELIEEVFIDKNKDIIVDPIGPSDPRLVYRNLPQALLSLKMIGRGTDIPPNTRLEFLYVENPQATHQGQKAEDFTYYTENKDTERFKPDRLHYIEKQLAKPMTEILSVVFEKEPVIYEKIDDALKRVINEPNLDPYKKAQLEKVKTMTVDCVPRYTSPDGDVIGRDVFDLPNPVVESKVYKYRGFAAKAFYVIQSSEKNGVYDFDLEDPLEKEIVNVCKRWRARSVLDKIYKRHGVTKRAHRKPKQFGMKLTKGTKVIFTRDYNHHQKIITKGTHASVISFSVDEDFPIVSTNFTLHIGKEIVENIPRKVFSTYYIRDSAIMKDILLARTHYKNVVDSLSIVFSKLVFQDE